MFKKALKLTLLCNLAAFGANANSLVQIVDDPVAGNHQVTVGATSKGNTNGDPDYDSTTFAMPNSALNIKKDTDYEYLELRLTRTERLKVLPDGRIVFTVLPEPLESNARALLGHTKGANLYVDKNFPKALRMYNRFQLTGNNVLDILDQMIAPFYDRENVVGDYHPNEIVTLKIGN